MYEIKMTSEMYHIFIRDVTWNVSFKNDTTCKNDMLRFFKNRYGINITLDFRYIQHSIHTVFMVFETEEDMIFFQLQV